MKKQARNFLCFILSAAMLSAAAVLPKAAVLKVNAADTAPFQAAPTVAAPDDDAYADAKKDLSGSAFGSSFTNVSAPAGDLSGDDMLNGYLGNVQRPVKSDKGGQYTSAAAPAAYSAVLSGNKLEGLMKALYDSCAETVKKVAAGTQNNTGTEPIDVSEFISDEDSSKLSWTKEELGASTTQEMLDLAYEKATGAVTEVLNGYLYNGSMPDSYSLLLNMLTADFPYDLYWFDKTVGLRGGFTYTFGYNDDSCKVSAVYFLFSFAVSADYYGGTQTNEYGLTEDLTDVSAINAVNTAKSNAQSIVSANAAFGDAEKLAAYKAAICELTDYNHSAAAGGTAYGDPWQIIYVFDGDPDTKVVCEGYAKAFQYLCNLTEFSDSSVYCISVTGNLYEGSAGNVSVLGAHMWNILHFSGKNYLIDITNDDSDTLSTDYLFMKPAVTGSAAGRYYMSFGNTYLAYKYDAATESVFDSDMLSVTVSNILGDATADGKVDVADCVKIIRAVKNGLALTDLEKLIFDVNCDGSVSADDAILAAQICAKLV